MASAQIREKLTRLRTLFSLDQIDGKPKRVWETFHIYDDIRGFGPYHQRCKQALKRNVNVTETALVDNGYTIIQPLNEEEASDFWARLENSSAGYIQKRGNDYTAYMQFEDESVIDELLDRVFNPEVDAQIVNFFGSEYVPWWYSVQRAEPNVRAKRAFCWHCDKGPSKWLKILLYFTNVADTGGATTLVDRQASDVAARAGYTFGPLDKRTDDLSGLEKRTGYRFSPITPDLRAGQGVLFEPAQLLHRGIPPTMAPRKIMQILLLPSPVHWKTGLEKLRAANPASRQDLAFPAHARELEEVLTS